MTTYSPPIPSEPTSAPAHEQTTAPLEASAGEPILESLALLDHRTQLALYATFTLGATPLEISMTSQGRTRRSAVTYLVGDTLRASGMPPSSISLQMTPASRSGPWSMNVLRPTHPTANCSKCSSKARG